MYGRKPHERVKMNHALQEREELKLALKRTELSLNESVSRLMAFQRRLDRGARRGRQRQFNQCISAPYKANVDNLRTHLVRDIQQQTRDFLLRGGCCGEDDMPDEGPTLDEEDQAILKEVAEETPALQGKLAAELDSAQRRPSSASSLPAMGSRHRSYSSPAASRRAASSPTGQAGGVVARTDVSDTVITAFLEHLGPPTSPEPLHPTLLRCGSQPSPSRSESSGQLEAGRSRASLSRQGTRTRSLSKTMSVSIDTGSRPGTALRGAASRPQSPAGTPAQAHREASPANPGRSLRRPASPASCAATPQAWGARSQMLDESSRRSSGARSPVANGASPQAATPKSPAAVNRTLFRRTSPAKLET